LTLPSTSVSRMPLSGSTRNIFSTTSGITCTTLCPFTCVPEPSAE
tara:strand:+ start:35632 stop:35766 length:135 start_codon:yes stop_codon:yes gene_type:complete